MSSPSTRNNVPWVLSWPTRARASSTSSTAEIGGGVRHLARVGTKLSQDPLLVGLGHWVVELKESDAGRAEAQRPAVVAGGNDHDLANAALDGLEGDPVEPSRPTLEHFGHGAAPTPREPLNQPPFD